MGTPFTDRGRELAKTMTAHQMAEASGRALSHGWWRRLVLDGPWGSNHGTGRVNPPPPETVEGIAALFGLPEARVRQMIVEDWYGVRPDNGLSDRVQNFGVLIDLLDAGDYDLVRKTLQRLVEE
jgi:hypothetical protein